jgi:NDP-sugar pyrophosphorylase family protein
MRAVVMAGGRGTRLAPFTTVLPKPLMPLHDRPIIDVILRQLVHAGIDSVCISVGHLGSLIEAWVSHEGDYGVPVSFVYEDIPLGTAGALKNAAVAEGTFLALNGDILTTLPVMELVRAHERTGAIATVAVKQRTVSIEYGVIHSDDDGRLVGLDEKPKIPFTVSMGVYAFDARITEYIDAGERIDFPDLLLRAQGHGERVSTHAYDGYWRDIGNREDYEAAVDDFAAAPQTFIGTNG